MPPRQRRRPDAVLPGAGRRRLPQEALRAVGEARREQPLRLRRQLRHVVCDEEELPHCAGVMLLRGVDVAGDEAGVALGACAAMVPDLASASAQRRW